MLKSIENAGATTIVWDGDDLDATGFTSLVPLCVTSGVVRHLVAFRRDNAASIAELQASWGAFAASQLPVTVVLVPHEIGPDGLSSLDVESPQKWAQLGRVAFQCSGSRRALCLGGGATVVHEVRMSPDVQFDIWCVSRKNKRSSAIERTAFESFAELPLNVVLHTPPFY